ncbi:MAG: methyltransferase domain-containing protein [Actinomycetota bacterium]
MTDPYAALADDFVSHYGTLRGAVRFALVSRQLDAHLPPPPGRIADVGGGAGHQAIRLARSGYEVALLDPSEEMLGKAREALDREPSEVQPRVSVVLGRGEDSPRILGEQAFDAVLCHGVVMYLEDPSDLIRALGAVARPGGIISLVAKNAESLAMRAGLEGRFRDALSAFDSDRDRGGLGAVTRGDTVAGLTAMMDGAGIDLIEWCGVRVLTDHLGDQAPGADLAEVIEAEWEAGRRDPYRMVARLLHLMGRRRT